MDKIFKEIEKTFLYWWKNIIWKALTFSTGVTAMKSLAITLFISIGATMISIFMFFMNMVTKNWVDTTIEQVKYNIVFIGVAFLFSLFVFFVFMFYLPAKINSDKEEEIEKLNRTLSEEIKNSKIKVLETQTRLENEILEIRDKSNNEIIKIKSLLPNVIIKHCGIDPILPKINQYGANSLLCRYLNTDRRLFYVDFINDPENKNSNTAIGISVYLKYYNEEGESVGREHFGRWMEMPEVIFDKHIKTNISSDGEAGRKRLGIGYYDFNNSGIFNLLDAQVTDLNEYGIISGNEIQYLDFGKYFIVASVRGENIQDILDILFEIEIGKIRTSIRKIVNEEADTFFENIEQMKNHQHSLWKI